MIDVNNGTGLQARAALAFILQGLGGGAGGEAERDADDSLNRVSVSSDSYGSFPVYDAAGRLLQYRVRTRGPFPCFRCSLLPALHLEDNMCCMQPLFRLLAHISDAVGCRHTHAYLCSCLCRQPAVYVQVVKPSALLGCVRDLHAKGSALHPTGVAASSPPPGWPLQRVLRLVTANPAVRLGLGRKGRIALGADADLLLFRPQDLELR